MSPAGLCQESFHLVAAQSSFQSQCQKRRYSNGTNHDWLFQILSMNFCVLMKYILKNCYVPSGISLHWRFISDQTGSQRLVWTNVVSCTDMKRFPVTNCRNWVHLISNAQGSSTLNAPPPPPPLYVLYLPPTDWRHAHGLNWEVQIGWRHEYKRSRSLVFLCVTPINWSHAQGATPQCDPTFAWRLLAQNPPHSPEAWGPHHRVETNEGWSSSLFDGVKIEDEGVNCFIVNFIFLK